MKEKEEEKLKQLKEKPKKPQIFVIDGIEYTFEEIDEMVNGRDWQRTF